MNHKRVLLSLFSLLPLQACKVPDCEEVLKLVGQGCKEGAATADHRACCPPQITSVARSGAGQAIPNKPVEILIKGHYLPSQGKVLLKTSEADSGRELQASGGEQGLVTTLPQGEAGQVQLVVVDPKRDLHSPPFATVRVFSRDFSIPSQTFEGVARPSFLAPSVLRDNRDAKGLLLLERDGKVRGTIFPAVHGLPLIDAGVSFLNDPRPRSIGLVSLRAPYNDLIGSFNDGKLRHCPFDVQNGIYPSQQCRELSLVGMNPLGTVAAAALDGQFLIAVSTEPVDKGMPAGVQVLSGSLVGANLAMTQARELAGLPAAASALSVSDLNGDGVLDLGAVVSDKSEALFYRYLTRGGTLERQAPEVRPRDMANQTLSITASPGTVVLTDLDGDRNAEWVVVSETQREVWLLRGDGVRLPMAQGEAIPVMDRLVAIAAADHDGDGQLDLLLSTISEGTAQARIAVHKGRSLE